MPPDCACPLCGSIVPELPFAILPERGMVVGGGAFVQLTGKEALLLARLAEVYPRPLTKEAAIEWLYQLDPSGGAEIKIVDVFICKLRKKIGKLGIRVDTLWGRGYVLAGTLRIVKEAA